MGKATDNRRPSTIIRDNHVHEMRHLSRHIERACGISPYGEDAAYLAGDIGQRMFPVARKFICEHCRKRLGI